MRFWRPSGTCSSIRRWLAVMYNMFKKYVRNLQWQLDMLAQVKLRLEVEFGIMQGLVEDLNNYKDGINKHQR